jgi:hypothetical protein
MPPYLFVALCVQKEYMLSEDDKELQQQVQNEIAEILPDSTDESFEGLSLTPQEILFAFKLVELDDNVAAYRAAFGVSDYKKCLTQSTKLSKKKDIIEACKRLREEIWQRAQEILPLTLLQDIKAIRNLDILDYYDAAGTARMLDAIPLEKRKLINNVMRMVNSKTGESYLMFDLPNKASVTKTLLDLIKVRAETGVAREDTNTMKEAQDKVNEIFENIGVQKNEIIT